MRFVHWQDDWNKKDDPGLPEDRWPWWVIAIGLVLIVLALLVSGSMGG